MNQILIERDHHNMTFNAKVNDTITITLKENPTTGYRWKLDNVNEKILLLQDSKYSIYPNSGVGGGGIRNFTFTARSPCRTEIHLSLKREWEKEKSPLDDFVVFIQVT